MLNLHIIAASVRSERKGIGVARWIAELAEADACLEPSLLDLAEIHPPMDDEPHHPRLGRYE